MTGDVVVGAAGRVNLIGGHVDFHDGLVVSMAIDREVRARARPRDDELAVVVSADHDGTVAVPTDGSVDPRAVEPAWGRLVGGVVRSLVEHGLTLRGADVTVTSTLEAGRGLSSSAAFCLAVGSAVLAVAGRSLPARELAAAAQRAEHVATGVQCGIQDQMTSVMGGVILLDCRDLAVEALPLPHDTAVVVIDSGVVRTLEASPWARRRAESFEDARALGLDVLRDATVEQVAGRPRARHVVDEIARVSRFADALRRGDAEAAGELMTASHGSSRDLWRSSTTELDAIVEDLLARGAYGARLTGGGFGGCVVGLVPASIVDRFEATQVVGIGAPAGRR